MSVHSLLRRVGLDDGKRRRPVEAPAPPGRAHRRPRGRLLGDGLRRGTRALGRRGPLGGLLGDLLLGELGVVAVHHPPPQSRVMGGITDGRYGPWTRSFPCGLRPSAPAPRSFRTPALLAADRKSTRL